MGRTELRWIPVCGGRLALQPRPATRRLRLLASRGCTHLVTLLSEREGALEIRDELRRPDVFAAAQWVWMPFADARPPGRRWDAEVVRAFRALAAALKDGSSLMLHCAAGIHRTGMVANALLRWLGYDSEEARVMLSAARPLTADQVGDERLAWGDRFAEPALLHAGPPPEERFALPVRFYSPRHRYGWLSNFSPHPIELDGVVWPTAEHAYQAAKLPAGHPLREAVRVAPTPGLAKRAAWQGRTEHREDWEPTKVDAMSRIVRAKLAQHPDLVRELLATGHCELVEHTRRDRVWGDGGDGTGANRLGRILMDARADAAPEGDLVAR